MAIYLEPGGPAVCQVVIPCWANFLEAARIGRRLLERRARDARSFGESPSFPNDKEPRARARTPTIHHRAHLRAVPGFATGQSGPSPFGLPQASHPRPGDLGEARSDFSVRLGLS